MNTSLKSPLIKRLTPATVALLYVTVAAIWITVSGYVLTSTFVDPVLVGRLEMLKGLAFVAITGTLLYLMLRGRETAVLEGVVSPVGRRLVLIFISLVLVVPLIGIAITLLYRPQIEREAYANLEAIARLKGEQIESWLDEREGDSEMLATNGTFVQGVYRFMQTPGNAEWSKLILDRFDQMRIHHHYSSVVLVDSEGRLLLASGEDETSPTVLPELLQRTLATRQVQYRDIYRDKQGDVHLEWVVPMVVADRKGERAVAAVVLRITAQDFIFPLIQTWPTASPSGETLLVRRDGESVMFLNELRHRKGSALKLSLFANDLVRPASIAIRSMSPGTIEGRDYRDVQVLAAYRPVKGTNWHLVAKVDRAEIMAPLRNLVVWVSLIALVAIALISVALLVLWRQQQHISRLEVRARSMAAIERSERHFRSLFENMLEGYAHCRVLFRKSKPEDFVFLEVNPAFETMSGLKDVVGKLATEAIPGLCDSNPELLEIYGRVAQGGRPEQFETYVAPLGRWFSVAVYCPEPEHIIIIFDNITERKQAEQVLAESEQRFRSLVEQPLAGIYIIQDGQFVYVNPRLAEIAGYASPDEMIGLDPVSLVAEKDRSLVAEKMSSWLGGEAPNARYGFTVVRRDGSLIAVGGHGARAMHHGRPAIIGLLQDVSERKRVEEQIQRYVAQLEESFLHTIQVATNLVEMRDPYTAGHERRVAEIAVAIGTELELDKKRLEGLRVGGYIHDIGKVIVPSEILSKPGKLSAPEYELIKGHPQAGYDILKEVSFPWPVAEIAHQHHERMDGSGYPRGLKGDEILLEARITAVADVVEAMSSHRPYRPGIGVEAALAEIESGSGTRYCPAAVGACLRLFREKGYKLPT